jgi:hypothetical protein
MPIHELERYMRCKDCSEVWGYPHKRSHLVALRRAKISASDPPSHWWSGGAVTGTMIQLSPDQLAVVEELSK